MPKKFAVRLYHLRKHKTLYTHSQMANMLHIDRSTYTKYENGVAEPSIHTIREIKRIFNVSYDELFCEELSEAEIADYQMIYRKNPPV